MEEDKKFYQQLKEHYAKVLEPNLLYNRKRDECLFKIIVILGLIISVSIFLAVPNSLALVLLKVFIGIFLWSVLFMCIHVIFHIHMWKNRNTLKQRKFPFYHHYIDIFMYSKYKEKYHMSQIEVLTLIICPTMYIDNVLGACMFIAGLIDMYTHQWYHTEKEKRQKDFNLLLLQILTLLERFNVINTREHLRIHHAHDVKHLDEVQGWMDVSWPIIGTLCDLVGQKLYEKFKSHSYGYHIVWSIFISILIFSFFIIHSNTFRAFNIEIIIFHIIAMVFQLISRYSSHGLSTY